MKKIKSKIRSNYYGKLAISYFHCIESVILPYLISDEKAVKKYYYKKTGKKLDLKNPQTFSEKLNWYKLQKRFPLMMQCADKVSVKEYIEQCGYGNTLNEEYGVYYSVDDIDLDSLPNKFVLKAAHGSHMQYIIRDKNNFNWKRAKRMMKSWLRQNIYWSGREWVYKEMPRRIIAEKYLEDEYGELKDYKIYCFNGIPRYIDVDVDRFTNHYRNFYDLKWNFIPMTSIVPNNPNIMQKRPSNLSFMIEMAEKLSKPFQFVRVDLYEIKGKVYFGELTFFQDGGNPGYQDYYDIKCGEYWSLK